MGKKWLAMILAGGQGKRLKVLTKKIAKPAIDFGGHYRIIDFSLSNCQNSGIDTVGVLTQYQSEFLHGYIGKRSTWAVNNTSCGGIYTLPSFSDEEGGKWYKGTADAVYQNIDFMDRYNPEYVLILSGDHIYKMDYTLMLKEHKNNKADCTVAVLKVPLEDAHRFGIMITDINNKIIEFFEKPKYPKSNLASMGVYIFSYATLRKHLIQDRQNKNSSHDFGADIIPNMLIEKRRMFAYTFNGYWKDVGTVESLWQANMDLLADIPKFDLYDPSWIISSVSAGKYSQYIGKKGKVKCAIVGAGCKVFGTVKNSILSNDVIIEENAIVEESVLFGKVVIKKGAKIKKSIIANCAIVGENALVGFNNENDNIENNVVTLIGEEVIISDNDIITRGKAIG